MRMATIIAVIVALVLFLATARVVIAEDDNALNITGSRLIESDIIISKDQCLYIERGARLIFKNSGIFGDGQIVVTGNNEIPVTITSVQGSCFLGINLPNASLNISNFVFQDITMGKNKCGADDNFVTSVSNYNKDRFSNKSMFYSCLVYSKSLGIDNSLIENITPVVVSRNDKEIVFCSLFITTDQLRVTNVIMRDIGYANPQLYEPITINMWHKSGNDEKIPTMTMDGASISNVAISSIVNEGNICIKNSCMFNAIIITGEFLANSLSNQYFISTTNAQNVDIVNNVIKVQHIKRTMPDIKATPPDDDFRELGCLMYIRISGNANINICDNIIKLVSKDMYQGFNVYGGAGETIRINGNVIDRTTYDLAIKDVYMTAWYSYDSIAYIGEACDFSNNTIIYSGMCGLSIYGVTIKNAKIVADSLSIAVKRQDFVDVMVKCSITCSRLAIYSERWRMRDPGEITVRHKIRESLLIADEIFVSPDIGLEDSVCNSKNVIDGAKIRGPR